MSNPQKVLLLTGASRGIGHATVKRFSAAGWRVLTVSRQTFSEHCPWEGGEESHVQLDLSDTDGLAAGIETIREKLNGSPLHALVNNAGISPKGPNGERFSTLNSGYADWLHVYNVNLFAPLLLAQGLFDELVAAKGAIVNVTSIAGSRVHPFAGSAYGTSKAALSAMTREMAADFGPFGVRVNAIAPGEIDTAILSPGTEDMVKELPLRRLGRPEEVASTIYFLCDAPSSYVTGAEVHINGGQHV
ncbi:SDR family NAD(P)-dependent oxidoreductase [Sneathiella sp.]|jgi:NAD(P)-dependent dehydrogenase (short-subunit alcohol dehydrogenase family)|uniref:SDR family NAD(P)-dependent oxidoreductase n=1 Tax=Sneathiella sp. TaxID=1964365 RepID=UPI0039E3554F